MGIYSGLFLVVAYFLGVIVVSPKIALKIQNKWCYLLLYSLYFMAISLFAAGINFYEHNCSLMDIEIKKMLFLVITYPIVSLLLTIPVLAVFRINISTILLIIYLMEACYDYVLQRQEHLNTDILVITITIIYKIIKFFILRRNKKSIDCVDENINIEN